MDALEKGRVIDCYIVAPQNPGGSWQPQKVMNIIEWVEKHHKVDSSRIYVYGMSLGGVLGYAPLLTLELTPDGRFVSGQIHSFLQAKGVGPRLDAAHRAAREIRRLTALDVPGTPLVIDDEGHIRRK